MSAPPGRASAFAAALTALAMTAPWAASACDTLSVAVGESRDYVLEGTPGTGAAWTYAADASRNDGIVGIEALGYGDPATPRIGGPAPFRFTLTGLAVGTASLVFHYGRSWEAEPWRTETLRVEVAPR